MALLALFWASKAIAMSDSDRREIDESDEQHPVAHSLWITTGVDYIASSTGDDIRPVVAPEDRIKVNSAVPVSLRYSISFTNPTIPHYLPGGYQGLGIEVLNLGAAQTRGLSRSTQNVGYPILAYVFQGGPVKHFGRRLSLDYEWNFGAAFGWKPYSDANQCFNLTVGSRVNAYLNVGLNVNYHLNEQVSLFGGVSVSHFSNGNTSFPNPGVNAFGARIGCRWTLNTVYDTMAQALGRSEARSRVPDTELRMRRVEYDVMAWGATRKRVYRGGETPVLLPGHFACAGLSFAPMYRLNTWWRVGGSFDLQWDRSSDLKNNYVEGSTPDDIRFTTPSFWRQVTVGLSAHGELQMPFFAVNVGCGYNIVAPWENKGSYQNIALKTYLTKTLFLNIGYQLRNFHQQSSLMLGAGVSI